MTQDIRQLNRLTQHYPYEPGKAVRAAAGAQRVAVDLAVRYLAGKCQRAMHRRGRSARDLP